MSFSPHLKALVRLILFLPWFLSIGFRTSRYYVPLGARLTMASAPGGGNFGNAGVNVLSCNPFILACLVRWFGKQYYVAVPQRYVCLLEKAKYLGH